jgi:hypothetical protein
MTVMTTLDVNGWTTPEYRAVLDELGVEMIATPPGAPRTRAS